MTLALATSQAATPASAQDCPTITVPGQDCPPVTSTTEDDRLATTTTEDSPTTTRATATTRAPATTQAEEEEPSPTSTVTPTTVSNVLVPGDGTEGSESTTTTEVTATTVSSGPSDGTLILLVIIGLVLIAGVVATLTWRYWVVTRPPLLPAEGRPRPTR